MRRKKKAAASRRRLYSGLAPRPLPRPNAPSRGAWVQSVVSGVTAVTAIAALVYTAQSTTRQLHLTEQGQVTDRYSRATDQLGSEKADVRLGAIYSLERLMRDSPPDVPTIVEVLCAFVREHAPRKAPRPPGESAVRPAPDVQAVLTVLNRRPDGAATRIDLHGTDLAGADLIGAQLHGADLTGADLGSARLYQADLGNALLASADLHGATLTHAHLHGADLTKADLAGAKLNAADLTLAHLHDADLTRAALGDANLTDADVSLADLTDAGLTTAKLVGTDLSGAKLSGAYLAGANLLRANLSDTDLRYVEALTPDQIQQAHTDGTTRLPGQ